MRKRTRNNNAQTRKELMSDRTPEKTGVEVAYVFREAEVREHVEKVNTKGTITYGADNLQPQYLFKLVSESPVHGGIISQKADFIAGNGLAIEGLPAGINAEDIEKNDPSDFNFDEIINETAFDFEVLNYCFYHFKFSAVKSRWFVEPISAELLRPNEDFTFFRYSEDWKNRTQSLEKTGYKEIKSIFHLDPAKDKECILMIKAPSKQILLDNGKLSTGAYPIVYYSGAIPSILADIEMNHFHYSESVNGWTSNTILSINSGIPEPNEKKKQLKEIREQTTDRKKKGGITVLWSDGKERGNEILNIGGNNNDTRYLLTQEHGFNTIMIAHKVQNPALFALQVAGKLGNTSGEQVKQDFVKFMGTYVKTRRKPLKEGLVFGLKKLNNWKDLDATWREFTPEWIEAPKAEAPAQEMSEEQVIKQFENKGTARGSFEFLYGKEFDANFSEQDLINEFVSQKFATDLNEVEGKILQLIKSGESYKAIIDALGLTARDTSLNIINLTKKGLIKDWKLTKTGVESVAKTEKLKVLYTYEKRPDAKGPSILPDGRTRDFCAALINLDKAYTRDEINQISAAISTDGKSRDVWTYRGGWYTDPDSGKSRPSCRHYWKQNVILG